jgi:chromosome segregation ATPase
MVAVIAEMAPAASAQEVLRSAREEMQMLEYELGKVPEQLRAAVESETPDAALIVSLRRRKEELDAQLYVARVQYGRAEIRATQEEIGQSGREVEQLRVQCEAKAIEVMAAKQVLAERQGEFNELSFRHGHTRLRLDGSLSQLDAQRRSLAALIAEAGRE